MDFCLIDEEPQPHSPVNHQGSELLYSYTAGSVICKSEDDGHDFTFCASKDVDVDEEETNERTIDFGVTI